MVNRFSQTVIFLEWFFRRLIKNAVTGVLNTHGGMSQHGLAHFTQDVA